MASKTENIVTAQHSAPTSWTRPVVLAAPHQPAGRRTLTLGKEQRRGTKRLGAGRRADRRKIGAGSTTSLKGMGKSEGVTIIPQCKSKGHPMG